MRGSCDRRLAEQGAGLAGRPEQGRDVPGSSEGTGGKAIGSTGQGRVQHRNNSTGYGAERRGERRAPYSPDFAIVEAEREDQGSGGRVK